ncbi:helix-turn-helix domain-containing protein [Paenisporosarcina antarctica]|uniref:DNA-binding protein n=1 Tax=Paenisporosarcina antarctica TaxID=417367 RepID=A0A4V1ANL1_9BACL|nr:helix-turn-helix domain-containing protein [Paenisporosarcina antarctica]QBP43155.1 DNA-binding protein [Paenisporosarcina antarctica]
MNVYSVDEAFLILQHNKITSHKESVKRWLRQGKLIGQKGGGLKKNGWIIQEEDLHAFIKERLPEAPYLPTNPLPIVIPSGSTGDIEWYREEGRIKMWQQITSRNIWEGRYEFKKRFIQECIDHLRLDNKNLRDYLLENILSHKKGYAKPGVPLFTQ